VHTGLKFGRLVVIFIGADVVVVVFTVVGEVIIVASVAWLVTWMGVVSSGELVLGMSSRNSHDALGEGRHADW
jgi:hypothetical protein